MDLLFISDPGTAGKRTTMRCGIGIRTSMGVAGKIESKPWSERTGNILQQCMNMKGRRSGFQTESEECINILAARGITGTEWDGSRCAPKYSSQSQGTTGRYHLPIAEQFRTYRFLIESNHGRISVNHPLMAAVVQFSAWTLNHFRIMSNGASPFEPMSNKRYESKTEGLGEAI